MARYADLSDAEREKYNLPPQGFQGHEMTVVIQAPSKAAMSQKIAAFHKFAIGENYENFQVLSEGPDPDGGFKAVVQAHNFNPVTWASEQYHRAKLGVTEGVEQGRKKAAVKHRISQQGELAEAEVREKMIQQARVSRKLAAAPVRIATEEEVGRQEELLRRQRRLAPYTRPIHPVNEQPIGDFIFGAPNL